MTATVELRAGDRLDLEPGTAHAATVGPGWVPMRRGLQVKVAFHVDQLWFSAPGGIGTYVEGDARGAPGAEDPSIWISCRSDRGGDAVPKRCAPLTSDGRYPGVEVPHSIRTLYPSWDLLAAARASRTRWTTPTSCTRRTPPRCLPVRGDQRLVVTVHDLAFERFPELFPRDWRWLYRAGLRAAVKRADAILVPSQSTADDLHRVDVDPRVAGARDAAGVVARRPARGSRARCSSASG